MSNPYRGTWRIIEMEHWDKASIDLMVPGYITFREDHRGEFQFGAVHGDFHYRIAPYHDTERLEFAWEGADEDGRSLRTGNCREGSTFTKGMCQGSLWKKREEQTGGDCRDLEHRSSIHAA
jgi:hypothetical protein